MNFVPNVAADRELLEVITKAIKHLLRIIPKIGSFTDLGLQNLPQNVVQDIEIWLQVYYLTICSVTIKIHVLILLHVNILILSKLSSTMVITIESKQASKGSEIDLIMPALCSPVDDVNGTSLIFLMMIRGKELHDDLVVPILPKLHQVNEPHVAQIIHHLL
jgi:quinol-cytochrome oxidoreductase complex cytochrome b subunit